MTIEMAEAWIDRFDDPALGAAKSGSAADSSAKGGPKFKLPKSETAG